MWTFYEGGSNAYLTGTISGTSCDVDWFCLWFGVLWACRLRCGSELYSPPLGWPRDLRQPFKYTTPVKQLMKYNHPEYKFIFYVGLRTWWLPFSKIIYGLQMQWKVTTCSLHTRSESINTNQDIPFLEVVSEISAVDWTEYSDHITAIFLAPRCSWSDETVTIVTGIVSLRDCLRLCTVSEATIVL
jgi:hypothetical protein